MKQLVKCGEKRNKQWTTIAVIFMLVICDNKVSRKFYVGIDKIVQIKFKAELLIC